MYRMLPILVIALAVVMLMGAPAVFAADDVTVEGKVVKAADGKLTITDKDDKEHTATVAADAKITDAGLKNLVGLSNLKTLSLSNTKVTDKGLEHVKELTGLKTLHLKGTKVTEDGIKDLKMALIDH